MAILAQLQRLFSPRPHQHQASMLYVSVVEQARQPAFFEQWHVPDTLDGRYDMIILHLFLVLEAMKSKFGENPEWQPVSGQLIETFIADMDRSLREMGVGDTGVSRRIKAMASGFYGRMDAYRAASENPQDWPQALARNCFGTVENPNGADIARLTSYVTASEKTVRETIHINEDGLFTFQFAPV